ncbi:hypothetical protein [Paenibacillus lautus]|nr:hypothetical protein [Paenibacillus lautus]
MLSPYYNRCEAGDKRSKHFRRRRAAFRDVILAVIESVQLGG